MNEPTQANSFIAAVDGNLEGMAKSDLILTIQMLTSGRDKAVKGLDAVELSLNKSSIPIGNEHETYTPSQRVEILGTIKDSLFRNVDKLRAEQKELRRICCALLSELEEISNWRQGANEYDEDMGNPKREFCEDVELIEQSARLQFKKYSEDFKGL